MRPVPGAGTGSEVAGTPLAGVPAAASLRARVQRAGQAIARQPHLQAIRDGVVGIIPIILVGSAFLLLWQPPWPALSQYLPRASALRAGYLACAGLVSVYACVATALSLARRREVDPAASATTALAVFLVAQAPAGISGGGPGLALSTLGAAGLFPSFAAAILVVEVIAFFAKRKWGIKVGGGAPEVVVRSFAALLPSTLCIVAIWAVVHVFGIDLVTGITAIFRPLVRGGDTLAAVIVVVLIDSALWLVGVHGLAVLAAVRPLWLAALAENMAQASLGQRPTHVFTQEFFIWFTWQGGSGTTLALAFLLLFARSRSLRLIGRAGIVPAIFNINEPIVFGTPVVLNAKLAPAFILAPATCVVVSWFAIQRGFVKAPYIEVVWTLPAPVGAWLSTGGDPHAVALQLVNLALALLIWWPFLRRYDRSICMKEHGCK
jgi:cellobiose PTS system EIIC component